MTKSTITREESIQAVFDLKVGYRLGFADIEILKRVARMALAAMDSEPVMLYRQVNPVNGMKTYWAELDPEEFRHLKKYTDENAEFMTLYRHAQPDTSHLSRICAESYQVVGALADALRIFNDVGVIKALDNLSAQEIIHDDVLPFSVPEAAQPAPVVLEIPDEMTPEQAYGICDYHGDPVDVFARGANWMRQHIIDSTSSTATQEEKK